MKNHLIGCSDLELLWSKLTFLSILNEFPQDLEICCLGTD